MGYKKIDNRLRVLMENGIAKGHRSMFLLVGPKARDQVVILHQMLSKSQVKSRPSVLWCYKKELGFSSHRKKQMRKLQKQLKSGQQLDDLENMFETFIAQTNIRYSYYNETHKILGNTYGMLVLQDFEAITPNVLARTIETIEGGGVICILLNTIDSLKQLHTMTMDVHTRYRTEAHQDVVARFNERFILSVAACASCVVVDDKLNILPISSHVAEIVEVPKSDSTKQTAEALELVKLKESLAETQPIGAILNQCKTLDQAKAVLKFIDVISEKTLSSTVSLTAGRGRGKSAALGLSIAAAIAFNYSNIYVTSPSPENLKTLFEFILKGFDAISLKEHNDYEIIQSTNTEFNKAIVRINVFTQHRQCIQYIHPADAAKNKLLVQSAELLVIDEAAAIPLPIVKSLLGQYLVFMSSTINGYEGTGRSLSLKLLQQLRQQSATDNTRNETAIQGRKLFELSLNESIRYNMGDEIELWLNKLLCLDATIIDNPPSFGCPVPTDCNLYYINRDILFSYHKASENFLQRLMGLYVASHYKNSPNDLQMISDAPAHHLFCLLPPINTKHMKKVKIPDVLCFIQVCLEGEISQDSIKASLSRGKRASGDLIPWTIAQQFQDPHFASLSGARIVRIATNPNYQSMGYGGRSIQLLEDYYRGQYNVNLLKLANSKDDENENDIDGDVKKINAPLLLNLDERKAEKLDYLGVSFGLTPELLKFWKKSGFTPIYLRQTPNDLTGEHSCIMLKVLSNSNNLSDEVGKENGLQLTNSGLFDSSISNNLKDGWLTEFWIDFRKRFLSLLSYQFSTFSSIFALNILQNPSVKVNSKSIDLTAEELMIHFTTYDLKRLELYSQNMVDYHLIVDLLPFVARLYFLDRFGESFHMSHVQNAILLSIGLQHNDIDKISAELNLPSTQILGLFSRTIKKISNHFQSIRSKQVEGQLKLKNIGQTNLNPLTQSLDDELQEAADIVQRAEQKQKKALAKDLSQYAIKGSEDDWDRALKGSQKTLVSIKSIGKRINPEQMNKDDGLMKKKKPNFQSNNNRNHKKNKKFNAN
ncbi:hypothetical protein RDWZM_000033 [Blomia tropicalis]|uniref:RNA cytidine acetyltransferase n=1 Tax=Blomia tropicalis TaxID=40697 RepID=A0A9Q0MA30_BLOTA|nr:hypothetical protein RDWZM_000033 [Blomia tropicalis]